jgi:hypothetical protein
MEKTKKLYRVTLRGMKYSSTGVVYGVSYAIAENPDEAYKKVKKYLDEKDLGFSKDRALENMSSLIIISCMVCKSFIYIG